MSQDAIFSGDKQESYLEYFYPHGVPIFLSDIRMAGDRDIHRAALAMPHEATHFRFFRIRTANLFSVPEGRYLGHQSALLDLTPFYNRSGREVPDKIVLNSRYEKLSAPQKSISPVSSADSVA